MPSFFDRNLFENLSWLFIHTDNRMRFVIRTAIYLKHIFHCCHKGCVMFQRKHQHFFKFGLNSFLRTVDTVICDIESIYPNSTVLLASSRSVHFGYPSGDSLQARAMTYSSTSPVTFAGIGGVSRFFLLIVALSPLSQ